MHKAATVILKVWLTNVILITMITIREEQALVYVHSLQLIEEHSKIIFA